MTIPQYDNRLRFQGPKFDFADQVGLTGQDHDDYPDAGAQPRYDQMRMYLIALLANQSSFNTPVEYREGSLWFNLNTTTLQICSNQTWQDLSRAIALDSNTTLQQWFTAVKTQLTGDPTKPEPFLNAVFTTNRYRDPDWIATLDGSKLTGYIDANKIRNITGSLNPNLFPQLTIGSSYINAATLNNIVRPAADKSILFIAQSGDGSGATHGYLQEAANTFTYDYQKQSLVLNVTTGSPSLLINQTTPGGDAFLTLQHSTGNALRGVLNIGTVDKTTLNDQPELVRTIGDAYIFTGSLGVTTNLLLGTGGRTTMKLGTNRTVDIYTDIHAQDAANTMGVSQPIGTLNLRNFYANSNTIRFLAASSDWSYIGLSSYQDILIADGTFPGDLVLRNPSGIRFSVDSGRSTTAAFTALSTTFNQPVNCATLSTAGATGTAADLSCVDLACDSIAATGTITGIIASSNVTGLDDLLATLALDDRVVHTTGDETITGSKVFRPENNTVVPVIVTGAVGQATGGTPLTTPGQAPLQEWRIATGSNTSVLLAYITGAGVFHGDGSGLTNINLAGIGTFSQALGILNGGTGADTWQGAQINLKVQVGADVQAYDADLDALAALTVAKGALIVGSKPDSDPAVWARLAIGSPQDGAFLIQDTTAPVGIKWSTNLTNPGAGSSGTSEQFGLGALASGSYAVAFGPSAVAGGTSTIAIGDNLSITQAYSIGLGHAVSIANPNTIVIGYNGVGLGPNATVVGYNAQGHNAKDVVIGSGAASNAGSGSGIAIGYGVVGYGGSMVIGDSATAGTFTDCILLGNGATATATNQFVAGSTATPITDIYFGTGVASAAPGNITIHGTDGVGTDITGSHLSLAGGVGTGTGSGGDIIFLHGSAAGGSSSTPHAAAECGRFGLNLFTLTSNCILQATTTGSIGLIVRGAAGQTSDLAQYQDKDNSNAALFKIAMDGSTALTNRAGSGNTPALTVTGLAAGPTAAFSSGTAAKLLTWAGTTATGTPIGLSGVLSGAATTNYGIYSNISASTNQCSLYADVYGAGTTPSTTPALSTVPGGTGLFGLYGRLAVASDTADTYGLYIDTTNSSTGAGSDSYGAYFNTKGTAGNSSYYGLYAQATATNTGSNYGIRAAASGSHTNIAGQFDGRVVVQNLAAYTSNDLADPEALKVVDASGSPWTASISRYGLPSYNLHMGGICEGRLSLSSTDPFPPAGTDITGATSLYYLPYMGDRITLYRPTNSTIMETCLIGALTPITITGLAVNSMYDVFIVNNGGSISLLCDYTTKWTNDSIRATALVRTTEGILIKSGASHLRYVGTIRTNATSTCDDSAARRYIWNYNNQRPRKLLYMVAATNWGSSGSPLLSWTVASWRPLGNTDAKHVEFVIGYQDGALVEARCFLSAAVQPSSTVYSSLQLDGSGSIMADVVGRLSCGSATNSTVEGVATAYWMNWPAAGYHYLTGVEQGSNTITCNGAGKYSGVLAWLLG